MGWRKGKQRISITTIFVYCVTASNPSLNGNEIDFMKHIDFLWLINRARIIFLVDHFSYLKIIAKSRKEFSFPLHLIKRSWEYIIPSIIHFSVRYSLISVVIRYVYLILVWLLWIFHTNCNWKWSFNSTKPIASFGKFHFFPKCKK